MKIKLKQTLMVLTTLLATEGFDASAQTNRQPGSLGREEFIEVEPNVRLHVTDLGAGKPVVLIHGWP
jgi:hypothetical protein